MRKKIIKLSAVIILILGSYSIASAFPWKQVGKAVAQFIIDNVDFNDHSIPCWSAGNNPEGCTGTYVDCSTCVKTSGYPSGGSGKCNL